MQLILQNMRVGALQRIRNRITGVREILMSVEAADKELRAVQIKAVGPEFHGPDAETLLEYMLGLELIFLIYHGGLMRLSVCGSYAKFRAQRVQIRTVGLKIQLLLL